MFNFLSNNCVRNEDNVKVRDKMEFFLLVKH